MSPRRVLLMMGTRLVDIDRGPTVALDQVVGDHYHSSWIPRRPAGAWLVLPFDEVRPMPGLNKVLKQAMGLNARERATLAERMLESLDELRPEEAERLWAEEADRRLVAYRAGRARGVPAAEVHRKARGLLR